MVVYETECSLGEEIHGGGYIPDILSTERKSVESEAVSRYMWEGGVEYGCFGGWEWRVGRRGTVVRMI